MSDCEPIETFDLGFGVVFEIFETREHRGETYVRLGYRGNENPIWWIGDNPEGLRQTAMFLLKIADQKEQYMKSEES